MQNKPLVEKKFGHILLSRPIQKLVQLCMGKATTRYSINRLRIGKKEFAVTNGRQLFALLIDHDFEQGLYFVTNDGYCLLDTGDGKFPKKWRDILPKPEQTKLVLQKNFLHEEYGAFNIIYELHRADSYFDLNMAIPVLQKLAKLQPINVKVQVWKEEPETHAFIIRGELPQFKHKEQKNAEFIYLQMPISKS